MPLSLIFFSYLLGRSQCSKILLLRDFGQFCLLFFVLKRANYYYYYLINLFLMKKPQQSDGQPENEQKLQISELRPIKLEGQQLQNQRNSQHASLNEDQNKGFLLRENNSQSNHDDSRGMENQACEDIKMEEKSSSQEVLSQLLPNTKQSRKYFNRSSNNSHKKYAACAKKNLFKFLNSNKRNHILDSYQPYKSSRIYFFCILIEVWILLDSKQFKKFARVFIREVKQKIIKYQNQAQSSKKQQLKKFRAQQVDDIKIALISFRSFFTLSIQEGIQCLYKKNKGQILKLPEYQRSVMIIKEVLRKHKCQIYNFDVEKFINLQLNRTVKNITLEYPPNPEYIPIFPATRRSHYKEEQKLIVDPNISVRQEKQKQVQSQKKDEEKQLLKVKLQQKANKKTYQEDQDEEENNQQQVMHPNFPNQNMFNTGFHPQMMPMMYPPNPFMPYGYSHMPQMNPPMNGFPQMFNQNPQNPHMSEQQSMSGFNYPNNMFPPFNPNNFPQ